MRLIPITYLTKPIGNDPPVQVSILVNPLMIVSVWPSRERWSNSVIAFGGGDDDTLQVKETPGQIQMMVEQATEPPNDKA
jgi:hypothetical protein